ncbi:type II toxin-antitoxin system death-on-curing family toxin [Chroococcidiopsis thermalis]|uniref:Death-on-curing family protein n=1 Tax=Chroococcidiopsis thermalis (strain PCC 7203) TaxID=251229 RepID=K9TTY3_CHRTP|nr:type II toxin-antitoxin system death-on-curing family toxin [Chroococcidiopsis thermalis]AFY85848.1 death-on-curing family protein [Chroococcidiopsis thermalis PCC 7203]PSB44519.1 type II toxin-antitoxin system death-on-curing family toxin [Cyanosarcina cf. burmensis CCALA 770]
MQNPEFLELNDILIIHQILLEQFGGLPGIRDEGLLEFAIFQPKATFFGELLHPTIHVQAAAYLYHIAKNHPFLDGNKRTAFGAMEAFLRLNGCNLSFSDEQAYQIVLQVAQGEISKEELTLLLKQHIKPQ